MKKEFVPYNLALRMKQLGFNEPCLGVFELLVAGDTIPKFRYNFYKSEGEVSNEGHWHNHNENNLDWKWSAPLYQQAFRWFREKYGLSHIWIMDELLDTGEYTYEEAELACLEKLIEIVEQSKSE
jgi:hypothetical protein